MAAPNTVFTIARVAETPGEDIDWRLEVALEMAPRTAAWPSSTSAT